MWLWILMILVNSIWIWGIIQQLVFRKSFGNNPVSDLGFIIIAVLMLVLTYGIFSVKLITEVRNDGIYYKFTIVQFKFRKINIEDINSYEIRKYNSFKEFGGYGIKAGRRGHMAYNIAGNIGIQFGLKNGDKVLIGTQLPNGFKKAVDRLTGKTQT